MGGLARWAWTAAMLVSSALLGGPTPARAASVVAYGDHEVVVATQPGLMDALQAALEQCSARDHNCRVLQRCINPGAGSVSVARGANGIIESIGSACGILDPDSAAKTAAGYCGRNAGRIGACQTVQGWQD